MFEQERRESRESQLGGHTKAEAHASGGGQHGQFIERHTSCSRAPCADHFIFQANARKLETELRISCERRTTRFVFEIELVAYLAYAF